MSNFTNQEVKTISDSLQKYMQENNKPFMEADECADHLNIENVLTNTDGPKPGFNFRQMLRDGRDGHIDKIKGSRQMFEKGRWYIYNLSEIEIIYKGYCD